MQRQIIFDKLEGQMSVWALDVVLSGYYGHFGGHMVAMVMSVVYVCQVFFPKKQVRETILYKRQQHLSGGIQVNDQ